MDKKTNRVKYSKYSQEEFFKICSTNHNDEFDYSLTEYKNSNESITVTHKICGTTFTVGSYTHLQNGGCITCANNNSRKTQEQAIKEFELTHGNEYDYSLVKYVAQHVKIDIIHKKCGRTFSQEAKSHRKGRGCTFCNIRKKLSTDEFLRRAIELNGDKYDYSKVEYLQAGKKVIIGCNCCGLFFLQRPGHHIYFNLGCPSCSGAISKKEKKWLDFLEIPNDFEHRQVQISVNSFSFHVDGLVDNTIYEFYGSYWHGDPRFNKKNHVINKKNPAVTAEIIFQKTLDRQKLLIAAGYELKFVWELDWDKGMLYSNNPLYWSSNNDE